MASTLPVADSCCVPCEGVDVQQVPGPKGDPGTPGTNGTNGINAYTTLTANFTMPAELATAIASVASSDWMTVGQVVFVKTLGYLEVTAKTDSTHATLKNLESAGSNAYLPNAAPGTVAGSGNSITPAGIQGPTGNTSGAAAGDLKGTYPAPLLVRANTKGMTVFGNGTDAKDLAVGVDGQNIVADATAALGVAWKKKFVLVGDPLAADNRVPRLDTASGDNIPLPLQSSALTIGDTNVGVGMVLDSPNGNARGVDAIDLQATRTLATQVASGARSHVGGGQANIASTSDSFVGGGQGNQAITGNRAAVVGGQGNVASGTEGFVGGGQLNTASNNQSVVAGGDSNTASGNESAVLGGNSNQATNAQAAVGGGIGNLASAAQSTVAGGANNTAQASFSAVPGGYYAMADLYGQIAHASGRFASDGDAQTSELVFRKQTADATPTELFLDGVSLRATIPAGESWMFMILLVARTSAGLSSIYTSQGVIQNNGGTTTAPSVTTTEVFDGAGLPATPVVVTSDNANDALVITCTGIAATNIRWVAHCRLVQVSYP
jgi:hypothetical protein